jgi:hypothetical protein
MSNNLLKINMPAFFLQLSYTEVNLKIVIFAHIMSSRVGDLKNTNNDNLSFKVRKSKLNHYCEQLL